MFDGLVVDRDVTVPMRDGVRLRTDVYRPQADGVHPVLLTRTPYSLAGGVMEPMLTTVARQGYVAIVQHCRGRYGSEGEFYPLHPDVNDGYDAVEWAAAQPWSNGKVGMCGASYLGMTQWWAAMARPPHLVAIAPVSSTWSFFGSYMVYYTPGVLALGMGLGWTVSQTGWEAERRGIPPTVPEVADVELALSQIMTNPDGFADASERQAARVRAMLAQRPLRDVAELRELAPWFRDWCDHDDPRDPYWRKVSPDDHIEDLDLPVLHVSGWYDLFTNTVLKGYQTMTRFGPSEGARRAQRLVIGAWSHMPGHIPRPDAPTGPERGDMYDMSETSPTMQFFRHHLKGENPELASEAPVRLFVMGANEWRDEWEWPLARTEWTSYCLHSNGSANTIDGDGTLSVDPAGDERPDSFVYDPSDPVPGGTAGMPPEPGSEPERTGRRQDVLVYTTPPFDRDVEVTGPVTLELWASSTAADTDFTAKLLDVFPDGVAVPLCQGVVRSSSAAIHPAIPGAVYRYEIDMWATANLFKTGHRLQLFVSSSEFPAYELNPNTGERITHDASGKTVPATQHVFHDDAHPSRLVLPIIPSR